MIQYRGRTMASNTQGRLKRLDKEDVYMTAQGVKIVQVYEDDLNALEAQARLLPEALDKYMRLVEHMTTILRAVRKSEGEQLSHEEIAERVVELSKRLPEVLAALEDLMAWQNGPPLHTYEKGWTEAMERARALIANLQQAQDGGA